jgi:hypothetical protein
MKRNRKIRWATVLLSAALVPSAWGQYQIHQDGRLLDANNRIGSGGINGPADRQRLSITGNDIRSGNVTGGWEFRGHIAAPDRFQFRGRLGSESFDRFVRNTVSGYGPNTNLNRSRFYGDSYGAPPPSGFVRQLGTNAIVPQTINQRLGSDVRLGYIPGYQENILLPQPGAYMLPGQVDPTADRQIFAASPVFGIKPLDPQQLDPLGLSAIRDTGVRQVGIDDVTALELRRELERTMVENTPRPLGPGGEKTDAAPEPRAPQQLDAAERITPDAAQPQSNVGPQQLRADDLTQDTALPPAGDFRRAAALQSSQYAAMQERYRLHRQLKAGKQPSGGVRSDDAEPADRKEEPANPATPGDAKKPDLGVTDYAGRAREALENATREDDETLIDPSKQDDDAKQPLKLDSLATGIKARGLEELLRTAEEHMRAGKFATALEVYQSAERVAPENPLIWMGRANAELGASFYARAEEHLRSAFTADPSLLMAQYNLRAFYGEERLQYLIKDLKQIATKDPKNVQAVFLLAYIAYNTDNERRAAAYLDLAEKRSGGDELLKLLREHWTLPKSDPDADLNK